MRWSLWLLSLFGIAVAVALGLSMQAGTVTLFVPPYRLDMSLNLVLIGLLSCFVLLYAALRGLFSMFELPVQARRWRAQQRERSAQQALLNAKSVAYSASASGVYLSTELFPKMGISEQMDKTARKIFSERVASVVARGEAELGFQQVSELLSIPGVDFIGELPPEAQKTVLFSAGMTKNVNNLNASRDLIAFLASPQAAPTIQKAGLKPVLPALPW